MLVLANGAFKSGSTWLFEILSATERFSYVPYEYSRLPYPARPWLAQSKIKPFLATGLHHKENYLTKMHLFSERLRDTLLSYDDVFIFDIKRDIKDSLVSHYYHIIREGKFQEKYAKQEYIKDGFRKYYWRFGRYKAQQLVIYHKVWSIPSPKIYITSFEVLKNDFENEVSKITDFLGMPLTPVDIKKIRDKTTLSNLQKVRGQDKLEEHKRFFRKGVIGEWRQHFDSEMLADVERIEQQGLGTFDMLRYHAVFELIEVRKKLKKVL
ncbi:sulfotransferase domain-containing protein [Truepera radiovictrix]|uniref:Sulfotransferase n=1 Tax=Truepera radiovictrix (strain DSM 17093 / CIP 108686 / LMG 22925 / RQ-24) TaxID=649638 RepID=D7CVW0_TRURR|nr:sulfotransferase domain-containing protein [Truepera radiovictrix]ADI16021.1 sulfotransferase [Truepera radiovictrix DSM 17093]WMT58352.1 sulfotransferase domain-containing protein [Truepera radiovictrix]